VGDDDDGGDGDGGGVQGCATAGEAARKGFDRLDGYLEGGEGERGRVIVEGVRKMAGQGQGGGGDPARVFRRVQPAAAAGGSGDAARVPGRAPVQTSPAEVDAAVDAAVAAASAGKSTGVEGAAAVGSLMDSTRHVIDHFIYPCSFLLPLFLEFNGIL